MNSLNQLKQLYPKKVLTSSPAWKPQLADFRKEPRKTPAENTYTTAEEEDEKLVT